MPQSKYRFEAIGTYFEIVTESALTSIVKQEIISRVELFDSQFSRFRSDSLVSEMAKNVGEYTFELSSQQLFEFYDKLHGITNGKVNPLVGRSLEMLGYDATYSLRAKGTVPAPNYESVISRSGATIRNSQLVVVDVGAAGKGYLVDEIALVLEASSINEFTIDASGDILHKGAHVERIGLEDPLNEGKVIGEISLQNRALCASASNRRSWGEGLHHIVDPSTGESTKSIIATWVIADSTMLADGISTALFFTDPEILKTEYTYEYIRIHADGSIDYSQGFEGSIY